MDIKLVLLVVAIVCELIAAAGIPSRINFMAAGLAFFMIWFLVP